MEPQKQEVRPRGDGKANVWEINVGPPLPVRHREAFDPGGRAGHPLTHSVRMKLQSPW